MAENQKKETIGFYGGKFSPPHMGHIQTALKASSMVDQLYVVVMTDEEWEKENLYSPESNSKTPYPSVRQRERWLREVFKDFPFIHVATALQTYGEAQELWDSGSNRVREIIGQEPTHVFYNEETYRDLMKKSWPNSEQVLIDPNRLVNPISATKVREEGPIKHWDQLPKPVQRDWVKKVAIIGTESTGKTTLVQKLANFFNTTYVEEKGRTLLEGMGDTMTLPSDYPVFAISQYLETLKKQGEANKVLFVDTEAWVTQNFSKLYEGYHQKVVEEIGKLQYFSLVLYLEPDVEWVNDGTRVFGEPSQRETADIGLKELLNKNGVDYIPISGTYGERFSKAVKEVTHIMET